MYDSLIAWKSDSLQLLDLEKEKNFVKKIFLRIFSALLSFFVLMPQTLAMQNVQITVDQNYRDDVSTMEKLQRKNKCCYGNGGPFQFKYASTFFSYCFHRYFGKSANNNKYYDPTPVRVSTPFGDVIFAVRAPVRCLECANYCGLPVYDCLICIPVFFRNQIFYYGQNQIFYDYVQLAKYVDTFGKEEKKEILETIFNYLTMPKDGEGIVTRGDLNSLYNIVNYFSNRVKKIWWNGNRPRRADGNLAVFCGILMFAEPFRFRLGEGDARERAYIRRAYKLCDTRDDSVSYVFGKSGPEGKALALNAQEGGRRRTLNQMDPSKAEKEDKNSLKEGEKIDNLIAQDISDDER